MIYFKNVTPSDKSGKVGRSEEHFNPIFNDPMAT